MSEKLSQPTNDFNRASDVTDLLAQKMAEKRLNTWTDTDSMDSMHDMQDFLDARHGHDMQTEEFSPAEVDPLSIGLFQNDVFYDEAKQAVYAIEARKDMNGEAIYTVSTSYANGSESKEIMTEAEAREYVAGKDLIESSVDREEYARGELYATETEIDQLTEEQIKEFDQKRTTDVAPTIDEELFDFDRSRNELYTDINSIDLVTRGKEAVDNDDISTAIEIFENNRLRLKSIVEAGGMSKAAADKQYTDFISLIDREGLDGYGYVENGKRRYSIADSINDAINNAYSSEPHYTADSPADTNATEVIEPAAASSETEPQPVESEEDKAKAEAEKLRNEINGTRRVTDEQMQAFERTAEDMPTRKRRRGKLSRASIKRVYRQVVDVIENKPSDNSSTKSQTKGGFATGRIAKFRRNQARRNAEMKLQDKKIAEELAVKREKERNA